MKRQTNSFSLLREGFKKSKKSKRNSQEEQGIESLENDSERERHDTMQQKLNKKLFMTEKESRIIIENFSAPIIRNKLCFVKARGDPKQIMMLLDRECSSIAFKGLVELTILRGHVQVMGFSKFNINKPYQIFSPETESLLSINLYLHESFSCEDQLEVNGLEWEDDAQRTVDDWINNDPKCAILLLKDISSLCGLNGIESMMPVFKSIFISQKAESLIPGFSIVNHKYNNTEINLSSQYLEMQISPIYLTKLMALGSGSVHCIVGGKNTGKSTLARHLTNAILSRRSQVAFLDCDVGQPELTPIGLVSLSILGDPLLGPPFTHLKVPDYARYMGSTSAKLDPDEYIALLAQLINIYKTKYLHLDLVVNTSGWVKGIGFDLLTHFINLLSPTNLIVLEGERQGSLSESLCSSLTNIKDINIVIQESVDENFTQRMKLNAADHRNLNLISYFMQEPTDSFSGNICKSWTFNMPLSHRNPVSVPLSKISLKFLNSQVPFSQIFYALNGTIVGLVNDATTYHANSASTQSNEVFFKIIPTHTPLHQANCLGLALVRSIDLSTNTIYLLTPVPLSMLIRVNLLVRGSPSLECPVSLLTHQVKAGKSALRRRDAIGVPYTTSFLAEGVGANEIKNRHLGRKKLQEK